MGDRLKDKVALVSGAGSSGPGWGNGKATAVLFAREGAKVLAADINLDAGVETKRIIEGEGGICEAVAGNVARADDVAGIVDACIATFGRIDVLHNNVGIVEVGGPVETTEKSWDRVNDVNLKSMFLTCKHVLPHMERQGKGAIVNIASVSGIRWLGVPYISYAATKAAIIQFTRVIALQYARRAYGPRRDQAGLPEIKEHKTTVVHKVDRKELVASIATMIERLGIALDPRKLLPQPVVVKERDIIEDYTERGE